MFTKSSMQHLRERSMLLRGRSIEAHPGMGDHSHRIYLPVQLAAQEVGRAWWLAQRTRHYPYPHCSYGRLNVSTRNLAISARGTGWSGQNVVAVQPVVIPSAANCLIHAAAQ
jgi:hypothetical protein